MQARVQVRFRDLDVVAEDRLKRTFSDAMPVRVAARRFHFLGDHLFTGAADVPQVVDCPCRTYRLRSSRTRLRARAPAARRRWRNRSIREVRQVVELAGEAAHERGRALRQQQGSRGTATSNRDSAIDARPRRERAIRKSSRYQSWMSLGVSRALPRRWSRSRPPALRPRPADREWLRAPSAGGAARRGAAGLPSASPCGQSRRAAIRPAARRTTTTSRCFSVVGSINRPSAS